MVVLDKKIELEQEEIVKGPDFKIDLDKSLGEYLMERMTKSGNNVAQIYAPTGESQTYAEILSGSLKVVQALKQHGIGVDDVVSICTTNTPSSTIAFLGAVFAGASINPLDPSLHELDFKHLLGITTPKLLFTEQSCCALLEEILKELNVKTTIVVFDPDTQSKHISFESFLKNHDGQNVEIAKFNNPKDHIVFLMSSSGTTGLPKVVSLTHANILFQLKLQEGKPFPPTLRILNMSTLIWISGVMVTIGGIAAGVVRILTPPFEAGYALETIEKYKVFWVVLGVTFFSKMVTHPKASKMDLSSVRMISIGGGKASDHHLKLGSKVFPNVNCHPAYGLTEVTGAALQLNDAKPHSIGYLIPGIEAKIVDEETGKTLGPNQSGELCIRGPIVFNGYFRNPKSTSEMIDKDGWLHTGDKCYYDTDKCFFIEGRIKEMFKCRGWQIAPLELETTLLNHPDIEEAAVVGIPHDEDVARPKAFLVKRQNSGITEDDVHDYMREKVSPKKQLFGGVVFVDSLPQTVTGKVQKRTLWDLIRQNSI